MDSFIFALKITDIFCIKSLSLMTRRRLNEKSRKFPSFRKILKPGDDKPRSVAPAKPLSPHAHSTQECAEAPRSTVRSAIPLSSQQHRVFFPAERTPAQSGKEQEPLPASWQSKVYVYLAVPPKQQTVQSHVTPLPPPNASMIQKPNGLIWI